MSNESILHKRTVLITNGCSSLSQALCDQLTEIHKCKVALVSSCDQQTDSTPRHHVCCNLSSKQQVNELASKLKAQFGPIELLIHQECGDSSGATMTDETEQFVSQTSNDILAYVNLLMCFVPDMLERGSGRVVAIKNTSNNAQAAIDCQPDYDDLVESICRSRTAPDMPGPENIRFTTILSDRRQQNQRTKFAINLNLTDDEIAERILQGIESDRAHVQVPVRRNLFEFCSTNIVQLATVGFDKLQLRKAQKIQIKVQ